MSEPHWERVWEIFHEAREAPPKERRAFVRTACSGDEALRRDVLELLAHDLSVGFLEGPPVIVLDEGTGGADSAGAGEPGDDGAPDEDSGDSDLTSAKKVGAYSLLAKIGEGGMGVVYKAHDSRLQRTVALKFLSAKGSIDPTASQRQLREARTAAALNHPNIATIYEIGESDDGGFIAMEFVDGALLKDKVRGATVPLETVYDWALQLCEALGAAHDLGIIHRDIKSSNIMIARDGRVKVLDFGVALQKFDTGRLTESGMIIGTIDYMAPELLQGGTVTAASDVFSMGVVLYEMLTGRRPFRGRTPPQVMYQIVHAEPPPLTEVRKDLLPEFVAVVQRTLTKDPADRYSSAREVLLALRPLVLAQRGPGSAAVPGGARAIPGNLPVTTTTFIGREKELEGLESRLESSRLLTITGPGGAGKTRVSVELGRRTRHRFPMGVFLIELAALTEATQVVRTIARVLGVREETGRDLIDSVIEFLTDRKDVLLILDNCEHLIDASATTARAILRSVPDLKIVATSQQRLGLPGENVWQISTLSLPPAHARTVEELGAYEAVQLFVVRASQSSCDFRLDEDSAPLVAQICRRLDGIPLAIELAAVRVCLLPLEKLLSRLEDRFRLLTGGSRTSLPRQQTLRATVEWSLDLLTESELRLFLTMSVFSGGMSLEAVEHVCECACDEDETVIDLLGRLVDKSLVLAQDTPDGEPRYHLLQTLREYGLSRLGDSGHETEARERHAAFFLDLVEEAEPELTGPDQARWFHDLDLEVGNVETAIRWFVGGGASREALRTAAAMWRLWFVRGYLGAGREQLGLALQGTEPDEIRARALYGAGVLANDQGDYDAARQHFEECLRIRRSRGDRAGEAQTLNSLGIAARDLGDYARARELLEEGLEINREIENLSGTAMSIHALGITAHREGDCAAALELFDEGLEIRKSLGDRRGIAALRAHLGSVDYDLNKYDEAKLQLEEALAIFRELENKRGIVFALMYLGGVARKRGDFDTSWVHHVQGLTISRELGDKQHLVQSLEWLAALAAARGNYSRALELEGGTSALREQFRAPRTPMETESLRRDLQAARETVGESEAERLHRAGRAHSLDALIRLALQRS